MFGVVLFIQSIVTDQNNNFQQNFFIEDIDILPPSPFFVKFWGFEKCQIGHGLD